MGRLRYIGSKARIVRRILDIAGSPTINGRFFDIFSGTGVVSQAAIARGWKVIANDYLISSSVLTTARLLSVEDVSFSALGGYEKTINLLNGTSPIAGFIYREYTPSGKSASGNERRYFTENNGQKIDGMRNQIEIWTKRRLLKKFEKQLLTADLLEATNRIANIAGTYGCFLRKWTGSALKPILLMPRKLLPYSIDFEVLCQDAFALRAKSDDLVYLDPPYTKRQYAAYYHLLETVAIGDAPSVFGVAGLRPWEHKSSPFCFKKYALKALVTLILTLRAKRTIISYSSQGHVSLSEIEGALHEYGKIVVHKAGEIGRYRPNQKSLRYANVTEYLVDFTLHPTLVRSASLVPEESLVFNR